MKNFIIVAGVDYPTKKKDYPTGFYSHCEKHHEKLYKQEKGTEDLFFYIFDIYKGVINLISYIFDVNASNYKKKQEVYKNLIPLRHLIILCF